MFRFLAAIGFAFVAVTVASTAAGQMQYPLAVAAAQDSTPLTALGGRQ